MFLVILGYYEVLNTIAKCFHSDFCYTIWYINM